MTPPNLALIVVDCLRTDRLGCYGAARPVAPTIDSLAAAGVLFEQAIAAGFHTLTTMPAVLSGCHPSTHGGFHLFADERPRLPATLQELGYRTAAFVPNPYLSRARGYRPGFDHFDECPPRVGRHATHWQSLLVRGFNRLLGRWGVGIECPPYLDARSVTERALAWLAQAEEPFFLWLHYMDAHTPYDLQRCSLLLPGGRGQRPYSHGFWRRLVHAGGQITPQEIALAQRLYEAGIAFVDRQIARLVQTLDDWGRLQQTTFVIMADHGEEFYEHGRFGHPQHLYEENIHTPLVISSPGAAPGGRRISAQVRQIDLAPTLIELAGATPPAAMQGLSLAPHLRGETAAPRPAISQTNPARDWLLALREPPWKLIWQVNPETLQGGRAELYHLDDDPREQHNLAQAEPERVAHMQAVLREHAAQLDLADHGRPAPEEADPAVLERLQALGYVDGGA